MALYLSLLSSNAKMTHLYEAMITNRSMSLPLFLRKLSQNFFKGAPSEPNRYLDFHFSPLSRLKGISLFLISRTVLAFQHTLLERISLQLTGTMLSKVFSPSLLTRTAGSAAIVRRTKVGKKATRPVRGLGAFKQTRSASTTYSVAGSAASTIIEDKIVRLREEIGLEK